MLARLEQTIAIVQQFFIAERATSLDFDHVAKQVRDCHSGPLSYRKRELNMNLFKSDHFHQIQINQRKLFISFIHIRQIINGLQSSIFVDDILLKLIDINQSIQLSKLFNEICTNNPLCFLFSFDIDNS